MSIAILGIVLILVGVGASNILLDKILDNAFKQNASKYREIQLVLAVAILVVGLGLTVYGVMRVL